MATRAGRRAEGNRLVALAVACLLSPLGAPGVAAAAGLEPAAVVSPAGSSALEVLAAREVRRYFYVRTGVLLPIVERTDAPSILVARGDRPRVRALAGRALDDRLLALSAEERLLLTLERASPATVLVTGGSDVGVLYAAYRLAEHLGVRFALHGDVLPDERQSPELPLLDETGRPLFAIRGVLPFHGFPEGPDWWSRDDYKLLVAQLPKLGLNFLGLHTAPEGASDAEPSVWIGPPQDIGAGLDVRAAYAASYFTTLSGRDGYDAHDTSDYSQGAGDLFPADAYGNDVMEGLAPRPTDEARARALFARAASVLKDVFAFARRLGTKTCLGTETPLVVPRTVAGRLGAAGARPDGSALAPRLYEGLFRRIAEVHPLDYYWLFAPESGGGQGGALDDEDVRRVLQDVAAARAALPAARPPLAVAVSGGLPRDRGFDRELSRDVVLSALNDTAGHSPVDRRLADVAGRPKWAIPWLEDDAALTVPQLWVGRLRRDGADALRYGASGLIGRHRRTRAIAPNVQALAQAAWRQDWGVSVAPVEGPIGGYPVVHMAPGAREPGVLGYQRCGLAGYRVAVRNGRHTVTLRFAETERMRPGERVFDVEVEGRSTIVGLDLARSPGPWKPFDHVVRDIEVKDDWLDVRFVEQRNVACLAAIEVDGREPRRIDVGGPALEGYEADPVGVPFVPTADFWNDWAEHEFGPETGARVATLFERLDSRLPRPASWVEGPGGLEPDERPWWAARADYAFVDELAAMRPAVSGPLALERFDYWLESFRSMRGMAELRCTQARLRAAVAALQAASGPAQRAQTAEAALSALRETVAVASAVTRHLLAAVRTRGELGTIANWEQHVLPRVLDAPSREIARLLGRELPADARRPAAYDGPERLIVPTLRPSLERGEPLRLEALVLGRVESVQVVWRPLGSGSWTSVPLARVARGVFRVELPPPTGDVECVVQAVTAKGLLSVPAAGVASPHTIVLMP